MESSRTRERSLGLSMIPTGLFSSEDAISLCDCRYSGFSGGVLAWYVEY